MSKTPSSVDVDSLIKTFPHPSDDDDDESDSGMSSAMYPWE